MRTHAPRQARAAAEGAAPAPVQQALRSPGRPLDAEARAFMEPRFGRDFAAVRVHTGRAAAAGAASVGANAFTTGPDIVFAPGQYAPGTAAGRRLLAHELAHVVQQGDPAVGPRVQRDCSDPLFCTPYASHREAALAEAALRIALLPSLGGWFGSEVRGLWESYLNRSPGDSLAPVVFNAPGGAVEKSFAGSSAVESDQEAVLDLVEGRLSSMPGGVPRPHVRAVASLTNFLSAGEMENRNINFSNPFSIAGNIAGGIGSSDAGPDTRKITRANVAMEKVPLVGNSGYINLELIPHYEVFDAVDFCPGDCGAFVEQNATIPLSRLEASGDAYDVPFRVEFSPEPETRSVFFANLP
ncbi:MAG TPA: DUF4157 domain-containing protein [Longimicrobium sp.]